MVSTGSWNQSFIWADVVVSKLLIAAAGAAICGACVFGLCCPKTLVDRVKRLFDQRSGMGFAIGARLVLGVLLLLAASASRFPLTFEVLGWLTLAGAVAVPVIGRKRISKLLEWIGDKPAIAMRLWLLFGFAFGGFLVFGAV